MQGEYLWVLIYAYATLKKRLLYSYILTYGKGTAVYIELFIYYRKYKLQITQPYNVRNNSIVLRQFLRHPVEGAWNRETEELLEFSSFKKTHNLEIKKC